MTWRDGLPEIPADRIRRASVDEGGRRIAARRQRQRSIVGGGFAIVAMAGLVAMLTTLDLREEDTDDASEATQFGPEAGDAAAATEAAASETTVASQETEAEATTAEATGTAPDYTTIPDVRPVNRDVTVEPAEIFEQPGPAAVDCAGRPVTLLVRYAPPLGAQNPLVRWEVADQRGEAPMSVDGDGVATATVGPFAAATLAPGTSHEILVLVVQPAVGGDIVARAPTVVLRDCP